MSKYAPQRNMSQPPRLGRVRRAILFSLAMVAVAVVVSAAAQHDGNPSVEVQFRGEAPAVRTQGPAVETHFVAKPIRVADARGDDKYKRPQVDPVEKNGPIFVGWPKPKVALLFTGEQLGYLEPCGCAGLDNMKGGLMRRHSLIKQLAGDGWPLVMMDAGGHSKGFGTQPKIKLRNSIEALSQIGYHAVGLSDNDLRFELLSIAVNLNQEQNPLMSANVGIVDFDAGFSQRYRIIEEGGLKIGITAVLGERERKLLPASDELVSEPAEQALARVVPELKAAGCDQLVLLCYAGVADTVKLSGKFPQFDWVVAGKGGDEPPHQPTKLKNGAQLVEVGGKGKYAVVVGIYDDGGLAFRYQKVPLDIRFPDSPDMHERMVKYQNELQTLGYEGLGVKPKPYPAGGEFAGSAVCADCHAEAYDIWKKSPHAHATDTIVDLNPPRHFDPECISCHVTGWDDPKYVPWDSGYVNLDTTPHLTDQGCENCHGPAARHVAAENYDIEVTDDELEALRKALHMKIVENEGNMEGQVEGDVVRNCMTCHDLDNSPDFDFQKYWEDGIKH